jgi:hypothetical protein
MRVWCPCEEPYLPDALVPREQRFCLTCARWYHVTGCSHSLDGCLVKVQDQDCAHDLVELMATSPFIRGFSEEWGCKFEDWCIVGNGREVVYARSLKRAYGHIGHSSILGTVPGEMAEKIKNKLGPNTLTSTCQLIRQKLYLCRNCHEYI